MFVQSFHGGAFETGRINDYQAKFLIDEDILLVVPAYRLGPLGTLTKLYLNPEDVCNMT